ncbi:MAG: hypothetical protein COA79_21790 [Planctomycetota bacterium]|nr:MAG: hypothetical protein COA79_21790 [Planctomycetota bacterium]
MKRNFIITLLSISFGLLFANDDKKYLNNFVKLEIKIKENPKGSKFNKNDHFYQDYIDNNNLLYVPAIIVDKNLIITRYQFLQKSDIEKATLILNNGSKIDCKPFGLLRKYPFQVFKTSIKLEFSKIKEEQITKGKKYSVISPLIYENKLYFKTNHFSFDSYFQPHQKNNLIIPLKIGYHYDFYSPFSLLLNEEKKPTSIISQKIYKDPNKKSWFNPKEMNIISYDEIKKIKTEINNQIHNSIFFVHIFFKVKTNGGSYNSSSDSLFDANTSEAKIVGYNLDNEGNILIPYLIPTDKVKQIKKIEIITKTKKFTANFVGYYKNFHGIKVQCKELKSNSLLINKSYQLGREDLFFTVPISWTSATDYYFELHPNFSIEKKLDVNNRFIFMPIENSPAKNAFYISTKGKIIAFQTHLKITQYLIKTQSQDDYYDPKYEFLTINHITDEINQNNFELNIKPETSEAQSKNWFGVNIQALSKTMLEKLNASTVTSQGQIGCLINNVYENSPAHKIGIKPLDIILSFEKENGQSFDIDMENQQNKYQRYPFPLRKNTIMNKLSKFEPGKILKVKFVREGKILTKIFTVEKAPKDYKTADKFICKEIGLHIKDLTYEVRQSFNIKLDESGIIVSKVVRGKPAFIHRVYNLDIIKKINGKIINSVQEFKEIYEKALTLEEKVLNLQVNSLGKSHIIKIKL